MEQRVKYKVVREGRDTFVYAIVDGVEVGHAWFVCNASRRYAWLYYIGVEKGLSGQGIGSGLLRECEKEAARRGAYSMQGWFYPKEYSTSESLKRFYEKNGYTIGWDEHIMASKYLHKSKYTESDNAEGREIVS